MSTQERNEIRARDGWGDPASSRPARSTGTTKPGGDRLPRPPGRRRPGLAVIAVLLIVLGAAIAGLLALRIDERVPVLVARDSIGAGQKITAEDLSIARMATEGVRVISADDASKVIGRYASQEIPPGRLIDTGMLNTTGLLVGGQAAVGMALQPGRYPANGLKPGDIVQVVRSVDGNGKVIADRGTVGTVDTPSEGAFGASSNSDTVVTVVVPERLAPAVAAAGMANQVSLILIRRGDAAGGG